MAKNADREHFEHYREQTQVKHEILAAYLPAYFHILKGGSKNLVYIDGFAGRGSYTKSDTGEIIDGSPIRALKLIADTPAFADRVSTLFIEADHVLFEQLEATVSEFHASHQNIRIPHCLEGTFAERVSEILQGVSNLAPTFLFVDPCGVSGTNLSTIHAVMKNDKCEAFIFFNIDGVRRIAGLPELNRSLVELMGSHERAQRLYDELQITSDVDAREKLILEHYMAALREEVGAQYIVPFRVENQDKQKTSHYLIHASRHPLGFRIMKDVMWRRGHSEFETGALQFAQASRTNFIPLFDQSASIKAAILDELKSGMKRVSLFCESWVERPDDMLCEPAYKAALLELEDAGKIQVMSKDGKKVVLANQRRKHKGKTTLANDYYVRLSRR